jgi:hypothetical protein
MTFRKSHLSLNSAALQNADTRSSWPSCLLSSSYTYSPFRFYQDEKFAYEHFPPPQSDVEELSPLDLVDVVLEDLADYFASLPSFFEDEKDDRQSDIDEEGWSADDEDSEVEDYSNEVDRRMALLSKFPTPPTVPSKSRPKELLQSLVEKLVLRKSTETKVTLPVTAKPPRSLSSLDIKRRRTSAPPSQSHSFTPFLSWQTKHIIPTSTSLLHKKSYSASSPHNREVYYF